MPTSRRNHAGVETAEVQLAAEPGMLDLQAAILHHFEARVTPVRER